MREIRITKSLEGTEWARDLLPGLQPRAAEGALVMITPTHVVVDNRRRKRYNPIEAANQEGGSSETLT